MQCILSYAWAFNGVWAFKEFNGVEAFDGFGIGFWCIHKLLESVLGVMWSAFV